VADAATLDRAMELGTRYPRGPLAWAERLGLSAVLAGLKGLLEELGEPRYRPDPLLVRRAAVGEAGGEGV
jgi:3-hydroxybutyryl-CoA dehydrogenase